MAINYVFRKGASRIKEKVPVPNRYVQWWLWDWRGGPVFFIDDHAIMVFDLEGQPPVLHCLVETSYRAIPICNVRPRPRGITVVDLHPDPVGGIIVGLLNAPLPEEAFHRLVNLAGGEPWIIRRLQAVRGQ